jgi:hypothetical protein
VNSATRYTIVQTSFDGDVHLFTDPDALLRFITSRVGNLEGWEICSEKGEAFQCLERYPGGDYIWITTVAPNAADPALAEWPEVIA